MQQSRRLVIVRRSAVVIGVGIGVGIALVGYYLVKRFRNARGEECNEKCSVPNGLVVPRSADFIMLRSGRSRGSPSVGSSHRNSLRPSNVPPAESDLVSGLHRVQEVILRLERVIPVFDMVKNRSAKDCKRSELLSSVLDRLRVLETDISKIVQEGGYEKEILFTEETFWSTAGSQRAGTLSVLSDDSFLSAFEEFPVSIDDADVLMREPLNLGKDALFFYQEGINAVVAGGVNCRKIRTEFCCCEDDSDFKAKVWCLRQAFTEILSDEHNRVWLSQAGRQLIADLLRHARKDPSPFYLAYDAMIEYLNENQHMDIVDKELKQRGVPELGFWDVVLDYVLIDAFEDLARPPSAVLAVTRNMFLSQSMKESTLATVIWSMLKAKRTRLTVPDGFISHFYDISEVASPAITLGFLGTDEHLRELCHYFKEQMCSFIVDIYNARKVRYTSLKDLAEDIRIILETRLEMVQTRLSKMLEKKERGELFKKCVEVDMIVRNNINLIPINCWQFDGEAMEELRERKHRIVNERLTEQKQKLSKASKQRLAREMGVDCRTVSDVLDWMTKYHASTKPIKPRIAPNKVNESVKSSDMETEYKAMGPKIWTAEDMIEQATKVSDESLVKGALKVNEIRRKKRMKKRGSLLNSAESSRSPADALEGRKLALQRLQEKLEQFQVKRCGKMTAYQYEEKKKLKRRMSKLRMKERRTAAKLQLKNPKPPAHGPTPNKQQKLEAESKPGENGEKDEKLIFSKFDFIVRNEKTKEARNNKRDVFTGKDYKRLLEKAQKREENLDQIRKKNPEKASRIEDSIKWKKALGRIEGQKVKDNSELLKKSLKKKEKIREWRKKKWEKRLEHTTQMQIRRQEERQANIQTRRDAIKKKKMQKARKKGRIL